MSIKRGFASDNNAGIHPEIQKKYFFYVFNEHENEAEARLMTAWDTTKEDINGFVKILKEIVK